MRTGNERSVNIFNIILKLFLTNLQCVYMCIMAKQSYILIMGPDM